MRPIAEIFQCAMRSFYVFLFAFVSKARVLQGCVGNTSFVPFWSIVESINANMYVIPKGKIQLTVQLLRMFFNVFQLSRLLLLLLLLFMSMYEILTHVTAKKKSTLEGLQSSTTPHFHELNEALSLF